MGDWLWIAAGLVLLVAGGEALVRGAVTVARATGVSPLMTGLVLVGFGTSVPELVTSLKAAWMDAPGIAIGNVIGSNSANVLLILGLAAIVSPLPCDPRAFRRDGVFLALSALAVLLMVLRGAVGRVEGGILLAFLALYLGLTFRMERTPDSPSGELLRAEDGTLQSVPGDRWLGALISVMGLVGVIGGATLLVEGALGLTRSLGWSQSLVGVTVVAVGTSLPELAASMAAAVRGQGAIALGNIIGSNLFNIMGILGVTALIRPQKVPVEIITLDIWVMLLATGALILFSASRWTVSRWEGLLLFAGYGIYLGLLFG